MNTLSVQQLTIKRGVTTVADKIDLTLRAGQVYTILGPNGAGKSSLLKTLFGELVYTGTIHYNQSILNHRHLSTWRKPIAYMPQDSHADAELSTLEVVLLGKIDALHMHISDELLVEGAELLAQLGIAHLAHRPIRSLSGGQRQLAMFAQALLRRPEILLLDEPVSALDMYHQINLLEKVIQHTREQNLITLMVLHDLSLAAQFSDELILLAEGKIQAQGKPIDTLQAELLQKLYGVPVEILRCSQGLPVIRPQSKFLSQMKESLT